LLEKIVGDTLNLRRVAVTQEQIEKYNLPTIPKWDAETKKFYDAVETEALGQGLVVQLLRDAARLEQLGQDGD
jgi:hypothetical protein